MWKSLSIRITLGKWKSLSFSGKMKEKYKVMIIDKIRQKIINMLVFSAIKKKKKMRIKMMGEKCQVLHQKRTC